MRVPRRNLGGSRRHRSVAVWRAETGLACQGCTPLEDQAFSEGEPRAKGKSWSSKPRKALEDSLIQEMA